MRFQSSALNILNQQNHKRYNQSHNTNNNINHHINQNNNQNRTAQINYSSNQSPLNQQNNLTKNGQLNDYGQQQQFIQQQEQHPNQIHLKRQSNQNVRNNLIRNIPSLEQININNNFSFQNNGNGNDQFQLTPRPSHVPVIASSNRHQRMRQAMAQINDPMNMIGNLGSLQNQIRNGNHANSSSQMTIQNNGQNLNNQQKQINTNQIDQQQIQFNQQFNNNIVRRSSLPQSNFNGMQYNNNLNINIPQSNIQTNNISNSQNLQDFNQRQSQNQHRYRMTPLSRQSNISNFERTLQNQQLQMQQPHISQRHPLFDSTNSCSYFTPQNYISELNSGSNSLSQFQIDYLNQSDMSHLAMVNNEYFNNNKFSETSNCGFFAANGYRQTGNNFNQSNIESYNYDDEEFKQEYYNENDIDEELKENNTDIDTYSNHNSQENSGEIQNNLKQKQSNFVSNISTLNRRQASHNMVHSSNLNYMQNANNQQNNTLYRSHSSSHQDISRQNQQQTFSINGHNHTRNSSLCMNYEYNVYPQDTYSNLSQSQLNTFLPNIYFPDGSIGQQTFNQRRNIERNQLTGIQRIQKQYVRRQQKNSALRRINNHQNEIGSLQQNDSYQFNYPQRSDYMEADMPSCSMEEYVNGDQQSMQNSRRFYEYNNIPDFGEINEEYYTFDDGSHIQSDDEQSNDFDQEEEEEKQDYYQSKYDLHMNDNNYSMTDQYEDCDSQDIYNDDQDENNCDNNDEYEENQDEQEYDINQESHEQEENENDSQVYENNFNLTLQINPQNEINFNVDEINNQIKYHKIYAHQIINIVDLDNQMFENASQISLPYPRLLNQFARNLMIDLFNRNDINNLLAGDIYSLQISGDGILFQDEQDNQVPGMDQSEIDQMRTTLHTSSKTHKIFIDYYNLKRTCAICLSDFEEGERVKELNCEHRFHITCVDDWLKIKGSCPLCRENLTQNNREEEENQEI